MGRKTGAKEVARRAGVPVLPDATLTGDPAHDARSAAAVGYPLLVKAVAGGGGRGMRVVTDPAGLAEAVTGARREAASAFGDAQVFCERWVPAARHVEIQVFGDEHGGAIHLGERECSVQRRHQKVLEEAPSTAVGPGLRARMGGTAVDLVRELGYHGAGTVEFLLDDTTGEFHFLEMNTRLQVEHPVTEETTGLDLVRLQIEVARGMPLPITQDDVRHRGHAIEVRLYAEDPAHDFRPAPGPLYRYAHPDPVGVRFEDGVGAPGEVPAFYDPMLAKVIAHAGTRQEAVDRLVAALEATEIAGTATNREFLLALLRDPDFRAGATRTDFLDDRPLLLRPGPALPAPVHLAAAVAVSVARRRAAEPVRSSAPPGFRLLPGCPPPAALWHDRHGGPHTVTHRLGAAGGDTTIELGIDGEQHLLLLRDLGPTGVRVRYDGLEHRCTVAHDPDGAVRVTSPTAQSEWWPQPRLPAPLATAAGEGPVSEMPGTVVDVRVAPGDRVRAGQTLVVLEAMKMEHPARASGAGVVEVVHVSRGEYVEARSVLVTVAPDVPA